MKKSGAFTAALLAASLSMGAVPARAVVDIAADHPSIRYHGRFDFSNPAKPRLDWPGSAIEARFTGTSITVKISGGTNDYNVIIDGVWKSKLSVDGKTSQVAAQGLAEGTHTLLLAKRTEGTYGISTFEGFQLADGNALVALPAANAKKIQFIGDSYTAGYGDEATVLSCPDRRPFDNNYVAYGPLTARNVGADYSVQAISGIGMVHNYGDTSPLSARAMPTYIENTLFGSDNLKWDFSKWIPDIVVIALGTNDFSTAVKPTEAQYTGAYKEFLKKIRGWYPNAEIICMTYAVDSFQQKYVDAVAKDATTAGDAKIHRAHMPALVSADLGCDYHPNVSGQKKYADVLTPIVRQLLGTTSAPRPARSGMRPETPRPAPGETWRVPLRKADDAEWADARGRISGD